MEIPYKLLSEEALSGLIEEFVSREGTDYGHSGFSIAQKASAVRRQLASGRAVIVYDETEMTCNIVPKE